MPPPAQAAVSRPEIRALLVESLREAYRQGSKGHCGEDRIFARPGPFQPADMRAEVRLWHGELDTLVPVAHALSGAADSQLPRHLRAWRRPHPGP
jgi:hypothetical protein